MAKGLQQLFVYERDASRIELIIRIFYSMAIGLVLGIYGLLANICLFIQWFVILILGRRNESLSNFVKGYLEYFVSIQSYLNWMTDERPGIMPKAVEIHIKK
ncbi:MAG: DUF4389 domain-containing protein [Methanocellales archaeon]|nr:DUF4389 domain-containing protein [Methanocellales archaeon]